MLTNEQLNEIEKTRNKISAKLYDTRYVNKSCSKCKQRKPPKGGLQILQANGTKHFICHDCSEKMIQTNDAR
jgi:hypothetical protein